MVATLNDLFPGQAGRLQLIRVMLMLRRPDLKSLARDRELPAELETQLKLALDRVRRG